MVIRKETAGDAADIRRVNRLGFGRDAEGDLIDTLREKGMIICSLVAEVAGEVAGHVLFTPAVLDDAGSLTPVAALGPVAVLPERQRRGIGDALIRAGLAICYDQGYPLAVVLGHPDYYPRFGFRPSRPLGIRWEHDAPEEAFMVMALSDGALIDARGIIRYQSEFDGV